MVKLVLHLGDPGLCSFFNACIELSFMIFCCRLVLDRVYVQGPVG